MSPVQNKIGAYYGKENCGERNEEPEAGLSVSGAVPDHSDDIRFCAACRCDCDQYNEYQYLYERYFLCRCEKLSADVFGRAGRECDTEYVLLCTSGGAAADSAGIAARNVYDKKYEMAQADAYHLLSAVCLLDDGGQHHVVDACLLYTSIGDWRGRNHWNA